MRPSDKEESEAHNIEVERNKKNSEIEEETTYFKEKNEIGEKVSENNTKISKKLNDKGVNLKNGYCEDKECPQNNDTGSAEQLCRKKRKIQKSNFKNSNFKNKGEGSVNEDEEEVGEEKQRNEKDQDDGTTSSSEDKSSSSDEDHDGLLLTSKFKKKFSDLLIKLKSKDTSLLHKKDEFFFHDSDFDTELSDDSESESVGEGNDLDEKKNMNNEQKDCGYNENCETLEKDGELIEQEHSEKKDGDVAKRNLNYSEYFRDILLKEGSHAIDKEEEELIEKEKEACSKKNKKSYLNEQEELKKKILEACKVAEEQINNDDNDNDESFFTIKEKSEKEIMEEKQYYENFLKTSRIVKEEDGLLKEYWNDNLNKDEEFLRDYILKELWREDKIHNIYEEIDEVDDVELEKAAKFEKTYNFRYQEQNGNIINSNPRNIQSSIRIDLKKEKRKEKRREKRKKKRETKKNRILDDLKKGKKEKKKKKEVKKDNTNPAISANAYNNNKNIVHGDGGDDANKSTPPNASVTNAEKNKKRNATAHSDTMEDNKDLWFLCDECNIPISPLNYVYECTFCENFALCKPCFKKTSHEHDLKKLLVPRNCIPPNDYLMKNHSFKSNSQLNDYNDDDKVHGGGMKNNCNEMEYLENDTSGYEDLIDDMPIRFKYIKVKPKSFKLTTDFILKTDEETLNKMVPLKYVSPYYKRGGGD